MPIHYGIDSRGHFYQWGQYGHRYYFDPRSHHSRIKAWNHAVMQARAIYAHGWRKHA